MNAEHLWMDQGIQTFRMLLIPHQGTWQESKIARAAEEFITPSLLIYQGIHGGALPKSGSFLSLDAPGIVITAIKQSENGEDTIVRCVETAGLPTSANIDLRFAHLKWTGNFRASEIKTLRINKNKGSVREVNLLEE